MEQYRNELGLPCKSYPLERFDWTVWGVLTAALAVVRVEYRRFISGTADTNVPARRARARLLELVILEKIIWQDIHCIC